MSWTDKELDIYLQSKKELLIGQVRDMLFAGIGFKYMTLLLLL